MFRPVTSKVSFPEAEKGVLTFWKDRQILRQAAQSRADGPRFTLYDGPPTVNGNPGIHHVLSRIYKDVIPRYKTMKGFYVYRKAGWDTHGLPVELEVEKELRFNNKAQIEEFGIDKFNQRCRASATRYLQRWVELTDRIGFWVDMEDPYITYHNTYVESCWWILKQLWDKDLVYQGYRVTPHCPRCGTSLSSHEVALGYRDAEDPSIYIRFRLSTEHAPDKGGFLARLGWDQKKNQWTGDAPSILAWTTTPWTLTGNVALAVAPEEVYVLVRATTRDDAPENLILARALLDQTLGAGQYEILIEFQGQDLEGLSYDRLYEPRESFVAQGQALPKHGRVVTADFVSVTDGTGIVHIAPAFGEEDFELGRVRGLPMIQSVDLDGNMLANDKPWDAQFVKKADPLILEDLERRGILHHRASIVHTYPFCWRCATPLLYYAKPSWYIRTTAYRDKMISGNRELNWYPGYIKEGRFGDWLENNVDWAFSRERFWGTPLPVWRCQQCQTCECIGSIDELRRKPGMAGLNEPLDLHRPFVDGITFHCGHCGGNMKRLPEVLDAWFDSGAMPLAQFHYPFENKELFEKSFPADYIAEGIDQTRGWFYTLHALSTLLFERPCFRNVICLGHILDAKGEKMSKAKGNVVDPWRIMDNQGVDALRWYMFTASPPGNVKRFAADQVTEVMRKFLSTLWNTYSFFVIYANIDDFDPTRSTAPEPSSDLDRWIISELNQLVDQVDQALDGYDPTEAGRRIEEFVDYLSNWYVRRSRRRFWKSESDEDKLSAYFTLYQCLVTVSKLAAPMAPFVTEEIYQNLVRSVDPQSPESIHLCDFPAADASRTDTRLMEHTRLVMKVCSLGRAARAKAGIKVRQPLSQVIIRPRSGSEKEPLETLAGQILEELNVKAVRVIDGDLADGEVYSVVEEGGYAVGLTRNIPPELLDEGIAREIVHRLQTMRRSAGFEIADHIVTYYQAGPPIQKAIENLSSYIKQETLSRELISSVPDEEAHTETHRIDGQPLTLGVKKTG